MKNTKTFIPNIYHVVERAFKENDSLLEKETKGIDFKDCKEMYIMEDAMKNAFSRFMAEHHDEFWATYHSEYNKVAQMYDGDNRYIQHGDRTSFEEIRK